ncbi:MAG: nitroreductase family protein [Gammaproteobacteria bacterium]|jgi:nitroreductase|nr:nitroreductase family protein [Gammaproteobacteria bacterium]
MGAKFKDLEFQEYEPQEMERRIRELREDLSRRRTVREFSDRPVSREIIAECLRVAGSAPSGANGQPWHFVAVSDPDLKRRIRLAAEAEEQRFYRERAPKEWLKALEPLGTNQHKPFLETAPWLIVVFVQRYGLTADDTRYKHYYASESVGLASGFLLAALHRAGLASLTHTPAPMSFLKDVLGRPDNERPFMIVVAGYPAAEAQVPDIRRKSLDDIATFL